MKFLIIRFSSIGDLTQSLSIPSRIKQVYPNAEIHFVTRFDFADLVKCHPEIHTVWNLNRKDGFKGLLQLILTLRQQNYTHIYDAHNNLRSWLIRWFVPAQYKLKRPMYRFKRFLLLNFRWNFFEKPFSGQRDLLKPLEFWEIPFTLPEPPIIELSASSTKEASLLLKHYLENPFVVLVPSAAYELKRWPLEHWDSLIGNNSDINFVVLAGPDDHFTKKLDTHKNVLNLTGKCSLLTSAAVINLSSFVVSNDTGLLHIAEQLGKKSIALMGPAPFGFPSRSSTTILQKELSCRPCSKHGQGPCRNVVYHECLASITASDISQVLRRQLGFTAVSLQNGELP